MDYNTPEYKEAVAEYIKYRSYYQAEKVRVAELLFHKDAFKYPQRYAKKTASACSHLISIAVEFEQVRAKARALGYLC